MNHTERFLSFDVFRITQGPIDINCDEKDAQYVHFKVKKLKIEGEEKILVQIIDVSHKMLYNEVKAEKSFLSVINAAVSHELRNPLYSLVS